MAFAKACGDEAPCYKQTDRLNICAAERAMTPWGLMLSNPLILLTDHSSLKNLISYGPVDSSDAEGVKVTSSSYSKYSYVNSLSISSCWCLNYCVAV